MSFQIQNKVVLLSAAPPAHLTLPFFHGSSLHRLVLIVCRQFVNDFIALKFYDNMHKSMMFLPISILYGYHLEFQYSNL